MDLALGALQGPVERRVEQLHRERFLPRLLERDRAIWADPEAVAHRLGWLDVAASMRQQVPGLVQFAQEVHRDGFRRAVLLGMGGSSLCPEVLDRTFGPQGPTGIPVSVLDSTVPDAVLAVAEEHDLRRTLFLVATKSGTTIETLSFYRAFWQRLGGKPGAQFVAITDPGTPLVAEAQAQGFRRVFLNPADIGGRYSALSLFGLVPAALLGIDLERFLGTAVAAMEDRDQVALTLGATLGEAALAGRNKITFVLSPALRSFGEWVEQLVAESTGKQGRGLVPVVGEPLQQHYGDDRLIVSIRLANETEILAARGTPLVRLVLPDKEALGAAFWQWEVATALAAIAMRINPFDEPNVTEAKEMTGQMLERHEQGETLGNAIPLAQEPPLQLFTGRHMRAALGEHPDLASALARFFKQSRAHDYFALLCFIAPTEARTRALGRLRAQVAERLGVATTLGYGPRYLHSTGQLHKGGPDEGIFLELTSRPTRTEPIPGAPYGFETLSVAQALGDLEVLDRRGRRAIRIELGPDADAGLAALEPLLLQALPRRA